MGIQIECLIFGEEVTKVQEYCLKDKNLKGLSKTWLVDNSRVKKSNKLLLKDYIVQDNVLNRGKEVVSCAPEIDPGQDPCRETFVNILRYNK